MTHDHSKVFALSKLFHERARLGIMTVLVASPDGVEFGELLDILKLTKGNLAVHASKLEEAGAALEQDQHAAAVAALLEFAAQLNEYGLALHAEEPRSSTDRETAGDLLQQASVQMQTVAQLLLGQQQQEE